MRLFKLSPWLATMAFTVAAIILVVLFRYSRNDGIWDVGQEFEAVSTGLQKGPGYPPVFAYWISGTGGEVRKVLRLLKAVYHPRNHYLLHLDAGSSVSERTELAQLVQSEKIFVSFRNVDVVGKTYVVDRTGPSAVAATLHGAAVLLRINKNWDWLITLSSSDYPLVSQDGKGSISDILFVLAYSIPCFYISSVMQLCYRILLVVHLIIQIKYHGRTKLSRNRHQYAHRIMFNILISIFHSLFYTNML